jgi:hypothetical protein
VGCNTEVHGSNARNLSVQLSLSQTSKKCPVFLIISCVFSLTKLEKKRAEQVLPGSGGGGWLINMLLIFYKKICRKLNKKGIEMKRKDYCKKSIM